RYVEFMKKVVPMHDDLFDFFYEALPGYEQVGNRRILLGCWGSFQDPEYWSGPTAPRRRTPASTATAPSATSCAR
ncbi:MAG: hypothetical protein ACXVYL_13140, partial [Oryzihumus sp.]